MGCEPALDCTALPGEDGDDQQGGRAAQVRNLLLLGYWGDPGAGAATAQLRHRRRELPVEAADDERFERRELQGVGLLRGRKSVDEDPQWRRELRRFHRGGR